MGNKHTYFEVVRETIDEFANVEDFYTLDSFQSYASALEYAKKQNAEKGEQITIWENDADTLEGLNSWVIKFSLNGKEISTE